MSLTAWLAAASVCLLAGVGQGGGPAGVAVVDRGAREGVTRHPGHEGHTRIKHDIVMRNDLLAYTIRYCACIDPSHKPYVAPLEGYIGMPGPTACNWYHSGFMRVIIDGEDIGRFPLGDFSAPDSGQRGMCRMVWEYPGGRVRVSFVLGAGKRYLACQILLQPKQRPRSVEVRLTCYPSFFTAYHRRKGARLIVTPATRVREGQTATVGAGANWWALYADEVFDPARGEGEGPCALLLVPQQGDTISFAPGGYSVHTTIRFKPDQRDIRLAFWDFQGMTNAAALKLLTSQVSRVLAELVTLDFAPLLLSQLDLAAKQRELEQVAAKVGGDARIGELRKLLGEARAAAAAAKAGDWREEKKLAKLLTKYEAAMWELRIQALFAQ